MGFAFKHGGLLVAPILTLVIALISVHCQHMLIDCSIKMKNLKNAEKYPDFAETVEQCFETAPEGWRKWSGFMKTLVNYFICVTQLGFCCIYFVFISTNIRQVSEWEFRKIQFHTICRPFFFLFKDLIGLPY